MPPAYTPTPAVGTGSRLPQLDLLRGVAILLVLFTHATIQPEAAGSWRRPLSYFRYLGPSGVDLFFVLSGFLVGGLLLQELRRTGRIDARRFLIRRGFKIWPPYFVFLAFVYLWLGFVDHQGILGSARRLLPNLVHLQNYLGSPRGHTWSLAVEEHFYVALPFALLLMLGRRRATGVRSIRALPYVAASLIVVCALLRLRAYAHRPWYDPYMATHLRIDALFFGVALGYAYHFRPRWIAFAGRHRGAFLALGAVLLALTPPLVKYDQSNLMAGSVGFTMVFVAYGCILLALLQTRIGHGWLGRRLGGPTARAVGVIGVYSYPIYLWHLDVTRPVAVLVGRGVFDWTSPELRWLLAFAAYVLVSVAGGAVMGTLVDTPALALRERLFPARVSSKPGEAPVEARPSAPAFP